MAFPDPVSTAIGGTSYDLNRLTTGGTDGRFESTSHNVSLAIVPTTTKGGRRVSAARLTQKKVTTDALVSTTNVEVSQTITVAFNRPTNGFTSAETIALFKALIASLEADSDKLFTKLINQES